MHKAAVSSTSKCTSTSSLSFFSTARQPPPQRYWTQVLPASFAVPWTAVVLGTYYLWPFQGLKSRNTQSNNIPSGSDGSSSGGESVGRRACQDEQYLLTCYPGPGMNKKRTLHGSNPIVRWGYSHATPASFKRLSRILSFTTVLMCLNLPLLPLVLTISPIGPASPGYPCGPVGPLIPCRVKTTLVSPLIPRAIR